MNSFDALGNSKAGPIHVHVCVHCGHFRKREEVGEIEINSGIFRCPKCGVEGPLNVEIREMPEE